MKHLLAIFIAVFILCCNEKKQIDPDILPVNKMQAILWDLIRADQYFADFIVNDSNRVQNVENLRMYEQIFQIHKTDIKQFRKSLDYYASDPVLFRPIIDSLAKKQAAPAFKKPGFIKKDSSKHSIRSKPVQDQ